eukprot:351280-Chlamydomonas_euryale.AAC.9
MMCRPETLLSAPWGSPGSSGLLPWNSKWCCHEAYVSSWLELWTRRRQGPSHAVGTLACNRVPCMQQGLHEGRVLPTQETGHGRALPWAPWGMTSGTDIEF